MSACEPAAASHDGDAAAGEGATDAGSVLLRVDEGGAVRRDGLLLGRVIVGAGGRLFSASDELSYAPAASRPPGHDVPLGGARLKLTVAPGEGAGREA